MSSDLQLPSPMEAIALELLSGGKRLYWLEMVKVSSGKTPARYEVRRDGAQDLRITGLGHALTAKTSR